MNLAFSVQSNHFNTDPEGVIESVHIRAFPSQGTNQTVRIIKRVSVKEDLTVYVKVLILPLLHIY